MPRDLLSSTLSSEKKTPPPPLPRRSSENKNKIFDLTLDDRHHNCMVVLRSVRTFFFLRLLPPPATIVISSFFGGFSRMELRQQNAIGNYRAPFKVFSTSAPARDRFFPSSCTTPRKKYLGFRAFPPIPTPPRSDFDSLRS